MLKGENSGEVIFINYMTNIVLCQVTCKLICFKLGMMLDTTKLFSSNDLDVHSRSQGHGKARTYAVPSQEADRCTLHMM